MILVTGGTGFIGSPTTLALAGSGVPLRLLVHRRPAGVPLGAGVEVVHGDLTAPASLRGICTGVHTVLHLAAEVGDDPQRCAAVNVEGTQALVAEARSAGVRRVIYLSTAAVYGNGEHRDIAEDGLAEDEVPPAPVSVASRTRLTAEHAVLATGGVVLRPMFVYGPGDAWFIPRLAGALRRFPVTIDGGRARQSLVAVDDLARAIAAIAVDGWRPGEVGVLHAAHPEPVTMAELTEALVTWLDVPPPQRDVPFEQARALFGDDPRRLRQLELIARDHVYDSSRLWRRTGLHPVGFARRFPEYADRYRATMSAAMSAAMSAVTSAARSAAESAGVAVTQQERV
ncbi:MAG TPA: NAD-dependent epimerase/dehydratase family protein [Pseudonocardiaceae bacterium]|nr:NAD-dependent epimerase/dehydratase family protein [Pseudonocardiaceae bacterium]